MKRGSKIYNSSIIALAKQDLTILKKNKKQVIKLSNEIDDLRDNIFYFIKNLDSLVSEQVIFIFKFWVIFKT